MHCAVAVLTSLYLLMCIFSFKEVLRDPNVNLTMKQIKLQSLCSVEPKDVSGTTLDFFKSNSFISNCTRFYKMIKQLQYWQIFGNSTDKQLIVFLSMSKKIIACTNLQMNEFERKLYLKYRNIENTTQLLCLQLCRLKLFIQVNALLFLFFYFF